VDGRLHVDEGLIDLSREDAPSLGDDVTVQRGDDAAGGAARDAAAAERRRDVALDLRIDLGERLRLRGRGIDTALRGELRLTSPQGRLAVDGSVRTVDGTFAAYGQKLTIERGIVAFNGPPSNPRLDIVAVRPGIDIRVGVAIGGNAAAPRVRLFSEPEMSETDKLSWLVLGRASEGLGRTDTAVLQRAALALIAGGNDSEGPAANLTRLIGLDEMSVRQSDGTVRETIVTLGKQLSARWYVGYERGLNATEGTWQLIYRVAQRFTLRAQSGLDNALDAIWTWRWQ
jgi:translocation and assembly module TamB